MDPLDPVRLSRVYEDVRRAEKPGKPRRSKQRADEYRPSRQPRGEELEDARQKDVFEPSDPGD